MIRVDKDKNYTVLFHDEGFREHIEDLANKDENPLGIAIKFNYFSPTTEVYAVIEE